MSARKYVALGDIADVNWGDTSVTKASYVPKGYPAFSATGCDGFLPYADYEKDAIVLSAIGARCGRTWYASGKWSCIKNTIRFWSTVEDVDNRYLYWATSDESIWPKRGAAQPFITIGDARGVKIPCFTLPEQRRIAEILDKAESLRAKRRAALTKLDTLAQSIFLDMFGDPKTNPKIWPRIEFCKLLDSIDSGWSPKCEDRRAKDGEWGVLKLSAVTKCEYDPKENKALPPGIGCDPAIEVKRGDLLFTRKNTYELVAACALVRETPPRLMMSDLIFRLKLKPNAPINSIYLHRLLINANKRSEIQSMAGGAAGSMPNISKARLQSARIELPPLHLQQAFARRIEAIEALKERHRTSLAKLDALFASLQHRAFRGEL